MRLVRRHSLILVGVFSFLVALAIAVYLLRTLAAPDGQVLFVLLLITDPMAFLALWLLLRRHGESPSPDALRLTLRRGRPVVVEVYSNT